MNSPKKIKSIQEILKQRQQSGFVGRTEQIDQFRRNLQLPVEHEQRYLIFNVSGQGGVGKSTLLRQFRKIAEEAGAIAAYIDEAERSVPDVMGQFAEQLEQHGHKLGQFSDRYRVFRQKKQELETDPEAPQGFSAFIGKSLGKTAVKLGRHIPGAGAAFEFVDEEAAGTQAGEWATWVAKKLTNKDDVRLVQEPIEVLTPLFLAELGKVAETSKIALLFDTYERTGEFLDSWLRDILQGHYGEVPASILFLIAGRQALDPNRWADYAGLIAQFPLQPFTDEEAQQYLTRKGITNPQVVEVILRLSGRLPLLVTTLAAESPNDPAQLGEPSGTAVERFLKWVDDPKRRQVALDAALPQCLNRDVLAQVSSQDAADGLFDWLRSLPFVEQRTTGWTYHEVVRTQLLRHQRLAYPQRWVDLHRTLATYYDQQRNVLSLDEPQRQRDLDWQHYTLNLLYHRLCQSPQATLPTALNEFLAALKNQRTFAERWADILLRAGTDANAQQLQHWGEQFVAGLKGYDERCYTVAVEMFTALVNHDAIEAQWQPVALRWRGEVYRMMKRYEEALKDFDQAVELDPNYAWAIAARGATYQAMKRYEEALQDLDRAIELDPNFAWAIAHRGRAYRAIKRYEEALQDLDRAIELDPNFAWMIAHRGATYQAMKRYEEALKNFDRTIELNPNDDWTISLRGETYWLMKRYEEALKDFDRTIELNPNYAWAIARRGEIYRLIGCYEEALKDFDRAIELDPNDAWAIASRGDTYRRLERYEKALKDFDHAVELNPNRAWALQNRGEIYLLLRQYKTALPEFNRAIEINPDSNWNLYCRALNYNLLKQPDHAQQDMNCAIQLAHQAYEKDANDWQNTFDLALYHLAVGHTQDAQHFYRDALSKGASPAHIKTAIQDLDDFLALFPAHAVAKSARAGLQKQLDRHLAADSGADETDG